jgi:hypothetical protein
MTLAFFDRHSEDVRVQAIIIAELEFSDIERHVFSAHFVECADYAAFEDRPEAFDGLCMDGADDVLTLGVGPQWHGESLSRGVYSRSIDRCRAS